MSPRIRQSGSRGTRADQGVRPTNISVAILLLLAGRVLVAGATAEIKVDQVGYLTGSPKVALVESKNAVGEFTVRRASDDGVAFRGALAAAVEDADSGDRVEAAGFRKVSAPREVLRGGCGCGPVLGVCGG